MFIYIYSTLYIIFLIFMCDPTPDAEICQQIVGKCWLGRSQRHFTAGWISIWT